MEELFGIWLKDNYSLSDNSIGKYKRAIRAVTKDMLEEGVIDSDLYSTTSSTEFELIKQLIFNNRCFDQKDTRGNRMYSVAMNHFQEFLDKR